MERVALALALCAVLAGCGATSGPVTPGDGVPATVTAVIDGDTVKIRYSNGTSETVRLVGVDTPEVHGAVNPGEFDGVPDTDEGRACLRRWGELATGFTRQLLAGRAVRVVQDPTEGPRGSYGRLLAYIRLDGRTANYRLVAEGYARVYESDFTRRERYRTAEARAQANGTGLWRCATATAGDTTAGRNGGSVIVATVRADPPGDDTENLTAEYVVLENVDDGAINITGWTVRDEAGHTYSFDTLTLAAGERVTLHTGAGTDTGTHRYWGRSGAIWNNDGDVVTVADRNGTVVARYRY